MNKHFMYSTFRFFFVLGLIVFGLVVFYYTATLTYPFIIAVILALIINPAVNFFEKKLKFPRSLSVIVSLLLLVSALAGLVTVLVTEVISGTTYLTNVIPLNIELITTYIENVVFDSILPIYDRIANFYENLDPSMKETIVNNIKSFGSSLAEFTSSLVTSILTGLKNVISSLPTFATVLIFSTLATFFISKDWERLKKMAHKIIPKKIVTSSKEISKELFKALGGYVRAQLTLISMTGIIVLIGLLILKVKFAITIAIAIAFVDLLPYLGTGFVFVPWIIYSFIVGESSFAIGLLILYIVVLIQRNLMEPKILSNSIGLDPLATLVSLFIGFKLIGFLGLIVGPVALVLIKTLHTTGIFTIIKSFILGKENN